MQICKNHELVLYAFPFHHSIAFVVNMYESKVKFVEHCYYTVLNTLLISKALNTIPMIHINKCELHYSLLISDIEIISHYQNDLSF